MIDLSNPIFGLFLFISSQIGFLFCLSLNFFEFFDCLACISYFLVKLFRFFAGLGEVLLEGIIFFV
jgi:hypothetical protein